MICLLYSSLKSASKVSEITVPDIEKQGKFYIDQNTHIISFTEKQNEFDQFIKIQNKIHGEH